MAHTTSLQISAYLEGIKDIADKMNSGSSLYNLQNALSYLSRLRARRGRLFILGNGGSAANASHAANDFRKIADIEAYAPTDNVAELTAWTNDVSWDVSLVNYLQTSHIGSNDMLLVLSVGGGSALTSANIKMCLEFAKARDIEIISIVSRDGGYAAEVSNVCILIPVVNEKHITPHAESWQLILIHLLANLLEAS